MTITTILLILAVVVVGYILYAAYTSGEGSSSSRMPDYMIPKASAQQEEPEAQTSIESESDQSAAAEELPEQPASAMKAQVEPAAAEGGQEIHAVESEEKSPTIEPAKITEFRNPETGETAANPSNYRFAKKWIKQAMVDEGLLEKVYKNKELKGVTEKRVKEALNHFKELEKYHG